MRDEDFVIKSQKFCALYAGILLAHVLILFSVPFYYQSNFPDCPMPEAGFTHKISFGYENFVYVSSTSYTIYCYLLWIWFFSFGGFAIYGMRVLGFTEFGSRFMKEWKARGCGPFSW
jgi:hypothetical protein